jgi:hypothetical protein
MQFLQFSCILASIQTRPKQGAHSVLKDCDSHYNVKQYTTQNRLVHKSKIVQFPLFNVKQRTQIVYYFSKKLIF